MKKIYSLLLISIATFGYGQFSENFDAATAPGLPAGWTAFRGTNGLGSGFDWGTNANVRSYSAPNCAYVRYEDEPSNVLLEDWLVTPLIDLTNYTNVALTYYGCNQYTTDYSTVYEIRVSTVSQTNHADFQTVQGYTEADFLFPTVAMTGTSLKTVDLSAYNGQQIYVAFVMIQDDGDNWFVDNVGVTGTLSNITFDTQNNSISPNPTTGLVTIQSNEAIESVKVIGLLGNVIKTYTNTNAIDLSDLNTGTYIVNIISSNGEVTTKKIVKN
jgi:hypothetical protein